MLWKCSGLGFLVAAVLLVTGLVDAPTDNNGSFPIQLDTPPVKAKRLQSKSPAIRESNFGKVVFQEDETSDEAPEFVNLLRQKPAKDAATALLTRPTGISQPVQDIPDLRTSPVQDDNKSDWSPEPYVSESVDESNDATGEVSVYEANVQQAESVEPTALAPQQHMPQQGYQPNRVEIPAPVVHKAVHRIEYGKSLSRRGASYAARQEFLFALGMIAQAIDAQTGGNDYTSALNNAVVAVREAADFYPDNSESRIGMNVARVLETHDTKIVSVREAQNMSRGQVVQRYLAYAENQFATAGGQHVVSAEAYFCLGKLHYLLSQHSPNPDQLDFVKAILFHRASLANDANNYRSASELGVLLARNGELGEAKRLIKESLIIKQTPQAWKNLAKVHERLGEREFADLAWQEYSFNVQNTKPGTVPGTIKWTSPEQFNASGQREVYETTARRQPTPAESKTDNSEKGPSKLLNKIKSWF